MLKKTLLVIIMISILLCISCTENSVSPEDKPNEKKDPPETVKDIDDNIYKTIKIGSQWWLVENLKVTRYRNGDSIHHVPDDLEWPVIKSGAYSIYDHAGLNIDTYGLLYNWFAVNDNRGIAPVGWHIPTDDEWKELEIFLGMEQSEVDDDFWRGTNEGGKLKEADFMHWKNPNEGATNESGFTALPNGYRNNKSSEFSTITYQAHFWASTEYNSTQPKDFAWGRSLHRQKSTVSRRYHDKQTGFGVRCIMD